VMEMELVPVGKYAPKRTDFSEKRTLQFYYHHMSMQSSSREATKQSLSRFKSDSPNKLSSNVLVCKLSPSASN
jgi:hypothetical protein